MVRSSVLVRLLIAGTLLLLPSITNAQDATISGSVTDSTGGVLPGATITAIHDVGRAGGVLSPARRMISWMEDRAMNIRLCGAAVAVGVWLAAVPAIAHHAVAAQYDMDKPIEITGALKKMEFINPHSMLHLDVTNPDGTRTTWIFQTTNAGTLRNRGLARSGPGSLEPGATYTVKGYAARNGNPMGFLRTLVFPDRREMVFWFGDPNGN